MRFMKAGLWLVVALLLTASVASAQSTTGTISGRVAFENIILGWGPGT